MLLEERREILHEMAEVLPEWAPNRNSIMIGLRGSDAHGTKLEKGPHDIDDVDVFSIIVHPREYYMGLDGYHKKHEHWDSNGETLDILVYDVRKFIDLAASCNPNVINWLYNRDEDYLSIHPLGQMLIDNREVFLSKQIFPRLSGYAYAQMKRMHSDQAYAGYMGEKRKKLVDEYGYDLKNAAHCVRLLGMANEIAQTGVMSTYRPDDERTLVMDIKSGKYSIVGVTAIIESLNVEVEKHVKLSQLPDHPDRQRINEMLVYIIKQFGR